MIVLLRFFQSFKLVFMERNSLIDTWLLVNKIDWILIDNLRHLNSSFTSSSARSSFLHAYFSEQKSSSKPNKSHAKLTHRKHHFIFFIFFIISDIFLISSIINWPHFLFVSSSSMLSWTHIFLTMLQSQNQYLLAFILVSISLIKWIHWPLRNDGSFLIIPLIRLHFNDLNLWLLFLIIKLHWFYHQYRVFDYHYRRLDLDGKIGCLRLLLTDPLRTSQTYQQQQGDKTLKLHYHYIQIVVIRRFLSKIIQSQHYHTQLQMSKAIIQPLIFASGISLFLYSHNQNLSIASYLSPLPFWILVGRPLGLLWNNGILKQLNKDVFPAQMRNYRELYLVSNRAVAYDLIFNHCFYNPLLASIIVTYTYAAYKAQNKYKGQDKNQITFSGLVGKIGVKILQMRGLVSLVSVMSEYWVSYLGLSKNVQGKIFVSNNSKRLLLLKEMLINITWNAYLLKKVHQGLVQ